jgi:hypothetical protein
MGRMKEICMEIIEANGGIPEGMTIADVARMKELEIYNWEEYERQQEKIRSQFIESENPGEIAKVKQVQKKFSNYYGEAREEKRSEQ